MSTLKTGLAGRLAAASSCNLESAHFVTTVMHQFAESLGAAIDAKDPHTSMHSEEVAEASHALALTMGLSPREPDIIHVASHLHDIGKIGVPDAVLRKEGRLTPEEWRAVRRHPELGANILRPVAALGSLGIVDMVLHHHERYDGKGYPARLVGAQIPLGARIISLADAVSAMLQDRPYRRAMDFDRVCVEVRRSSGTQFDPRVTEAFFKAADTIQGMLSCLSDRTKAA